MVTGLHVVVGLGASGFSCARYLLSQGVPTAVTDSRANPPHLADFKQAYPDVPVSLGKLDFALLAQASVLVLSPGVSLQEPVIAEQIKRGVTAIGDIELFARAVKVPVIAITGTNAKSTVTTLVGKMAAAAGYHVQVGGNLGVPALDLLNKDTKTNLYVLELSSFQLETTHSLRAQVATVLNVTPDHMDRYDSLAHYQQTKLRVYQACQIAVCNQDDPLTQINVPRKFSFTLNKPGKNEFGLLEKGDDIFLAYESDCLMPVRALPVRGRHYQANALAALAIGHAFGLSMTSMLETLREFTGLPHRCQFVREYKGVRWYNDSKGTNVGATQAAIEGLGADITGKLILIAGGVGKNADFSPLVPVIEKYVRHVVLIGEAAKELSGVLADRVPVSFAASMDEAVMKSAAAAQPDDSVLLSPACASFDMFKHFEHRGDVFTKVVENM